MSLREDILERQKRLRWERVRVKALSKRQQHDKQLLLAFFCGAVIGLMTGLLL